MFTSRAEYRLLLREDNADLRLTEQGYQLGLVNDAQWQRFESKRHHIAEETQRLKTTWLQPSTPGGQDVANILGQALAREYCGMDLLKRPELTYDSLMTVTGLGPGVSDRQVAVQVEIQAKYAGYIDRQKDEIARLQRHEKTRLPIDFNYHKVSGLSSEVCEKLAAARPETLGKAARIPG